MRRRDCISFLVGAMLDRPFAARAQRQPPLIAVLGSGASDAKPSLAQTRELHSAMQRLGLVEGRDYVFEFWWGNSDSTRFPALAESLLQHRPVAVVVSTILAAKAVQERSRTVPIVMTGMNDPVAAGLVTSLARPGGNITGVSNMAEDVLLKLLEIGREAMPQVRSMTVMSNPTNPSHRSMIDLVRRHGAAVGLSVTTVGVNAPTDLDSAFAEIAQQRPGALLVLTDNSLYALSEPIVARALAQGIPTFGSFGLEFVRAGAILSYTRDPKESFGSVARLLKKILGGAKPADLPVEQPTEFRFFINLKTARALGITLPDTLLTLADEVIE